MGIKRVVDVDFWSDEKVMDMFTPEDKLFFLYLLTNPHTTQLGIYAINPKYITIEMGYSLESVGVLLDRFENQYGIIKYSKTTQEIAVKNFLKHSIVKGGAPVRDCLIRELKAVKNKELIKFVFAHIKQYERINKTVRDIITEYEELNGEIVYCYDKRKNAEKENNEKDNDNENVNDNDNDNENVNDNDNDNENVNDNDNDNENDVSLHDSSNDTLPPLTKPKNVRHKYGEYKNVLLSDEDMEKLKTEFPNDYEERIERLSSYVASTGKSYKNHLATIRNWARKDKAKGDAVNGTTNGNNAEVKPPNWSGTWL